MRRTKRVPLRWLLLLLVLGLTTPLALGYARFTPATPLPPDPRPVPGFLPTLSTDLRKLPSTVRVLRTRKPYQAAKCVSQYRGKCVERVPLEEYVEGVVLSEEGIFAEQPDTLLERVSGRGAVKAAQTAWALQAVAARSYVLYAIASKRHRGKPFDVEDTPRDQAYSDRRDPRAQDAVRRTRGKVLVDPKGRLVAAEYSASCGGRGTWNVLGDHQAIACHPRCGSHSFPGSTHSRGMCQWGSFEFARDGATLEQLLHRYYPNTSLHSL